jgi:Flp pilus assembly protein TadD/nitrate/TMAO reductase-like tetraheme cytochrome c subunit
LGLGAGLLLLAVPVVGSWFLREPVIDRASTVPTATTALAVAVPIGSEACGSCHRVQFAAWQQSQHAKAMQHADATSVLGDFRDVRYEYNGVTTRFFMADGKYMVNTDGPDGGMTDYEVRYTFGLDPLQQYLVAFPDGRMQALGIAWDTRPLAQGGQRWFHLRPGQGVDFKDELHWSRRAQNWNFMCADCHATAVRKNYDQVGDSFSTTWTEIAVGCEGCHGPGSNHAKAPASSAAGSGLRVDFLERDGVEWRMDPTTGTAYRSTPRATEVELQVCAQCHSHRSQIADGYEPGMPFHDFYRESVLEPNLYHVDGQQLAEVHVSGSFAQSRMNHAGVTCSDCHDPHSAKTRAQDNAVCAGCHLPARYDVQDHHHHPQGSPGAQCVNCHMPEATYMVVDPRRDHFIRIPRPDLSVAYGTPNACSSCHVAQDAAWAAAQIQLWKGGQAPDRQQLAASAFAAADANEPGAGVRLGQTATDLSLPAITRATALWRLGRLPGPTAEHAATHSLADPDPLLRRTAVESLSDLPEPRRLAVLAPLLDDTVRTVRIAAASALAGSMTNATPAERASFERAANEFIAARQFNADTAEARTDLGVFLAKLGRLREAETAMKAAISLEPEFTAGYVNLVDLYRTQDREGEGEALLLLGLARSPQSPELHHIHGLLRVRQNRMPEALVELRKASQLAPGNARFAYVHAVALDSVGDSTAALEEIRRVLPGNRGNVELLLAAATFSRNAGDFKAMQAYRQALIDANPGAARARKFAETLVEDR